MDVLADLTEQSVGLSGGGGLVSPPCLERRTVRGLLFDEEGQIALAHIDSIGFHLPGGGIEPNETWQQALIREAVEEAGCVVALRPSLLGPIVEHRAKGVTDPRRIRQISVCGMADVVGRVPPTLSADERRLGLTIRWVSLPQAIALFKETIASPPSCDDPDLAYKAVFLRARDLIFLDAARRLLDA